MFIDISPSFAAILFTSCRAKFVVFPYYGVREKHPEIDVWWFDAPETNGVICFETDMKAFFCTEKVWEGLLSSITSHNLRLSKSCRGSLNEY